MAHYFNSNMARHGGTNEGLFTVKSDQSSVLDLERKVRKELTSQVWQCDTSESSWFYMDEPAAADELFTIHKSPTTMLHCLIDIVSKNGNLLMNIPQRADGTIDEHCEILLEEFAEWMKVNSEGIFGTRPWGIYGEGPSQLPRSRMNDLKTPMTSRDIRFTTKGDVLYAFVLGWPRDHTVTIRSLAKPAGPIANVSLLGCPDKLDWQQTDESLVIHLPDRKPSDHAVTFKIKGTSALIPAPGWTMGVPSPSGR
jgi:alpha-L-fucosidase